MSLTIAGFTDFYRELYGYAPFRWQSRLLERVATTGLWPRHIDAPTGAGKSSVVDIHVYANALAAEGAGTRAPRRLAVVVNRRALVDSQFSRAEQLAARLSEATEGVLSEVASALTDLGGRAPLRLVSLRGGQPSDRAWVDDPVSTMIIAATPDMWGSRLLFRGYGTSRLARPREAGLLSLDCVCVIDEAHLSRQLVRTASDVAALAAARSSALGAVPPLQVVSATATHTQMDSQAEGVTEADVEAEEALAARLRTPKVLTIISEPPRLSAPRHAAFLAGRALAAAQAVTDLERPTVLVMVNRRATAAAVADALATEVGSDAVALWAGRMRPMDVDALTAERPGLLSVSGHAGTRFLVTTQTAEVGVDLDCASLVTELAPGASLAQRFGRINRLGARSVASIEVIVPEGEITDNPPYAAADLRAAREWLETIGEGGDASPWRLRSMPPPAETLHRLTLSNLWGPDADLLARTTSDLFEEPDLAFWLRDDLEVDESPVGVALRRLPRSDDAAIALLHQVPVDAAEVFPTSIAPARVALRRALGSDSSTHAPRAFRLHDGEVELIDSDEALLRPGDQLILDHDVRVTWQGMLMPDGVEAATGPLLRVYDIPGTQVVFPGNTVSGLDLCDVLAGSADVAQATYDQLLAEGRLKEPRQVKTAPELADDSDALPWVVLTEPSSVTEDDEVRQEWSVSGPVLLSAHQDAVAARAWELAQRLSLPSPVAECLRRAGQHHDDGKQHPDFQRMLRTRSSSEALVDADSDLAKSCGRSAQQVKRLAATRRGWRHEQLSVAYAQAALGTDDESGLIARLIGTSHGHGRPFFPHGPASLVAGADLPREIVERIDELYLTGAGWSELTERTDADFGVWGVAYLEAVVRAADAQVSGEGS